MIFISWIILCFLVYYIAEKRGHNPEVYFFISLFLSPLVGLVLALVLKNEKGEEKVKLASGDYRQCPYCAELIKADAKVCKVCGRDLPEEEAEDPAPPAEPRKHCPYCWDESPTSATTCSNCGKDMPVDDNIISNETDKEENNKQEKHDVIIFSNKDPNVKQCLKCGYIRNLNDEYPNETCPQCGAVYAKVEKHLEENTTANLHQYTIAPKKKTSFFLILKQRWVKIGLIFIVGYIIFFMLVVVAGKKYRFTKLESINTQGISAENAQVANITPYYGLSYSKYRRCISLGKMVMDDMEAYGLDSPQHIRSYNLWEHQCSFKANLDNVLKHKGFPASPKSWADLQ